MNKVLAWKTNEYFTEGKEYECTNAFGRFSTDAAVEVVCDNGNMIMVDINDSDFTFMFNVRTCDGCIYNGDFYKPECRECRIIGKGNFNNYTMKQ